MKCWPGWASDASMTMWYSVIACASLGASGRGAARRPSGRAARTPCESPRSARGRVSLQRRARSSVAGPGDLAHEPGEQHRVAGLVDLLGGQEVLLLLARGGVDERGEVVGDRVLAVEEQRVGPQRARRSTLGEALAPMLAVRREVDLGGAPVALLPAGVQVGVGDLVGGSAGRSRPSAQRSSVLSGRRRRRSLAPFGVTVEPSRVLAGWPVYAIELTSASFGLARAPRARRSISSASSSIAIRSCSRLSRSRSVTVRSSSDWWSTVTAHGVPISSWRR